MPGFADGGQVNAHVIGDYAAQNWTGMLSDAFSSFAKKLKPIMSGNINFSPGAGIAQWVGTVLQALALTGQPASYSAYVLHQMQTESSGNPNAINLTDINAQRGIPSKGLMQVIDPTFRSYAMPGLNSNIYDPLSNIVASIRYVLAQYGSIPAGMRGVAYAGGGLVPGYAPGQDTVPAWLSPGEAVISRMNGHKSKNKALLDTAASWFGGNVVYPGDKGMPPVGFGGHTEIHNHYHTGNQGVNVETMVATQPGQATAELDYALSRCR
jgi:SLT domain-containing protein